ncbi:glycosyltransferase [Microbulbifer sp. 2205BS26-8]|uniref:glycosyltransferase n=1 Tax=Microbulbifer sp. 2205BS26-8 TaxID=3064386 RepID=UPI00273DD028|nr:glycosyltransferase [Microbulbifer sp. 2205BS26-8]MDP5210904.1 glycosyltransferase [Microbulbifer sp. 2205BS26-8]
MSDKKSGGSLRSDVMSGYREAHLAPPVGSLDREHPIYDEATFQSSTKVVEGVLPRVHDADFGEFSDLSGYLLPESQHRHLRVCITTEDIAGPVRNGGIGTTYTHLAHMLAKVGHAVTILYLRGNHSEIESIEHWIDHYATRNVEFVPVPDPELPLECDSPRWIMPMIAMYQYLAGRQFDLVHVSEWRGSAYYCLLAKRQGIAFQDTVFCVKTSSPWLWNRDYLSIPLEADDELVKCYAEKRSVELADIVVGGSAHLLRWMQVQGYQLPHERTHVQPNVLALEPIEMGGESARAVGVVQAIDELVFFGRLEWRKGLQIFCDAVSRMVRAGTTPKKVAFLGKPGSRIATHAHLSPEEYICEQAERWPFPIEIHTDFQHSTAIRYLSVPGRMAVMPSLIENSSLAVYEALVYRFPFLASDVGGTRELVSEDYWEKVLFKPLPQALWPRLAAVLKKGGVVAAPAFDNERNLFMWRAFHDSLGGMIERDEHRKYFPVPSSPQAEVAGVSVCMVHRDEPERLEFVLHRFEQQSHEHCELIVIDDDSELAEARQKFASLESKYESKGWKFLRNSDRLGYAASQNRAAAAAEGHWLLFTDLDNAPRTDALEIFERTARCTGMDAMFSFHEVLPSEHIAAGEEQRQGSVLHVPLGADDACSFYGNMTVESDLFLKRDAFLRLGGFNDIYRVGGERTEILIQARLKGYQVDLIPRALTRRRHPEDCTSERENAKGADALRLVRLYSGMAPLAHQNILWSARGFYGRMRHFQGRFKEAREKSAEQRDQIKRLWSKRNELEDKIAQLRQAAQTSSAADKVRRAELKEMRRRNAELTRPLKKSDHATKKQSAELSELRLTAANLEEEMIHLRKRLRELRAANQRVRKTRDRYKIELANLRQSTIWRLTKPLRRFVDRIRR